MRRRILSLAYAAAVSLVAAWTGGASATTGSAPGLQLPLPAKSLDCSSWGVTPGQVATPNPEFTKMYDLSGVPNIPPNKYPDNSDLDPCTLHSQGQSAGYCNVECGCQEGLAVEACVTTGKWGITYDDGPSQFTPTVLNTLKKNGDRKAMFFVIGGNVCQNPQQLIDVVNAGHEIGVHTWSHPRLSNLTNEQIIAEIKYTENAIVALTGVKPKYMRPPFGNMDARVKFILDKMGYTAIHWTADTNDWTFNFVPDTPQNEQAANTSVLGQVDKYIAADGGAKKGTISLEHDIARIPTSLAESVLAKITAGGWEPVPITSCLNVASWIRGGNGSIGTPIEPVTPVTPKSSNNTGNAHRAPVLAVGVVCGAVGLTLPMSF